MIFPAHRAVKRLLDVYKRQVYVEHAVTLVAFGVFKMHLRRTEGHLYVFFRKGAAVYIPGLRGEFYGETVMYMRRYESDPRRKEDGAEQHLSLIHILCA